jgi:hypothetical protein
LNSALLDHAKEKKKKETAKLIHRCESKLSRNLGVMTMQILNLGYLQNIKGTFGM